MHLRLSGSISKDTPHLPRYLVLSARIHLRLSGSISKDTPHLPRYRVLSARIHLPLSGSISKDTTPLLSGSISKDTPPSFYSFIACRSTSRDVLSGATYSQLTVRSMNHAFSQPKMAQAISRPNYNQSLVPLLFYSSGNSRIPNGPFQPSIPAGRSLLTATI